MHLKTLFMSLATQKAWSDFVRDTKDPQAATQRLWEKEIEPLLRSSSFWRERKDFRRESFDLSAYSDYESALLQALQGDEQPFNGEKIIYWSETSATSGKRKYFPITATYQKQFQRNMAPYFHSLIERFPDFLTGKILYLAASGSGVNSPKGIPMGLISHFNYNRLSKLIKSFYALPQEILIDEQTFTEWAPLYALANDLSVAFAITPIAMQAFYTRCVERFDSLLPYLLGQKALPSGLPALSISKKRRMYLQQIDAKHLSWNTVWPNLHLAGCWISGPCQPFARQLAEGMGESIKLVDGTYSATEGWMTVPIDSESPGGILHPGAHIVEFIEEGKTLCKENLLPCHALQEGKKYEVFLTTAMGFVRYRLMDIVKCTGFYHRSPKLEFCYKASQLLLEGCSISLQEFLLMQERAGLTMAAHWYFARNAAGNCLYLVVDEAAIVPDDIATQLHTILLEISEPYAHCVQNGVIVPLQLKRIPATTLLHNRHAQTKPGGISQEIITENGRVRN